MLQNSATETKSVQRSVLVLGLALTMVLLLTAVIFENQPPTENMASVPIDDDSDFSRAELERSRDRFLMLGTAHLNQNNYADAEDLLRKAMIHDRRNPEVMRMLAITIFSQSRYEEAELLFRQLTKIEPESPGNYINLAVSQLSQSKFTDAGEASATGIGFANSQQRGTFLFIQACVAANAGDTETATERLAAAKDLMGEQVKSFANAQWANDLRALPSFQSLVSTKQGSLTSPEAYLATEGAQVGE